MAAPLYGMKQIVIRVNRFLWSVRNQQQKMMDYCSVEYSMLFRKLPFCYCSMHVPCRRWQGLWLRNILRLGFTDSMWGVKQNTHKQFSIFFPSSHYYPPALAHFPSPLSHRVAYSNTQWPIQWKH